MTERFGKNTVQEILELLDQQRELLRSERPITDEQALLYRERLSKIRQLLQQLREPEIADRGH
jgi:hypothetical protein